MRRIVIGLGCLAAGMAIALVVVQIARRGVSRDDRRDSPAGEHKAETHVIPTSSLPPQAAPSGEAGSRSQTSEKTASAAPARRNSLAVDRAVRALMRPEAGALQLTEAQQSRAVAVIDQAYRRVEPALSANRASQRQICGQLADPRTEQALQPSLQNQLAGLVTAERELSTSADEAARLELRTILTDEQMQQVDTAVESMPQPGASAGGVAPSAAPIQ